ncbi:putative sporulation protein YtaF [Chlamydia abortus]|uniref:Putative manganese efflux pump MntP n=1 Tax=Paenibacillus residui TaxID=629724 RepID=A0ABW3DEI2_9BACL|nr:MULTISPECIES: manganese efflux pump [Paenibacillaceae]SHE11308.1 putative sporulation protein YtaF [Chlamydia abortus]
MILGTLDWGHVATLLLMAFALGMDAFSLGIGIGFRGIRLLSILKVSFVIGLFHILMPLMGMLAGHYVGYLLGEVATLAGGGLLILLGGHMIYSSLRGESVHTLDFRNAWGLLLFALMVSVDSFSVGVSMGMFDSDVLLTVLLFGFFGGTMSVIGLWLGRRMGYWAGNYGEAIGGAILLMFGVQFIL